MSGAQTSTAPNILFNAPAALGAAQTYQTNQLLQQQRQQEISAADMEQVSRAANFIMTVPPEQRPMAYKAALAQLRPMGYAKNAPDEYPGDQANEWLARQGTPSQTQAEWNANIAANKAYSSAPVTSATPAPTGAYGAGGPNNAQVPAEYMPFYQEASQRTGIPVDVLIAQHRQESGFNPNAIGRAGEIGIGQISPATAKAPGYGVAPIDPATLTDPRTNINFAADYLRARLPPGTNPSDPVAIRRALYNYNGGGDPDYVAHVTRYLPASAGGGTAVASTATAPPRPTTATATTGPVVVGDSLASSGGLGGSGVVGASPGAVRAQIAQGVQNGAYTGKDVVLSSGASNAPGDMANVEGQLQLLRNASSVKLLGVGPGIEAKNPGTNAALQKLAAQYGAQFVPLPTDQMSPDGVHPTAQGYAALKAATAPPGPAPQGGRYQVASNASVAPPASTAPPGPAAGVPAAPRNTLAPPPPAPSATTAAAPPAATPPAPASQPPAPAPAQPTAGSPGPPQLQPLNARGLTAQQQAQLDAAASTGRLPLQDRIKQEQALAQMNIGNQQKAFSDWIQTQQLATSQGQLSVSQANSALEYWKAAHPDAKVTMTGGEIITQDPRNGQEIAPRIQVTPQRADTAAMAIVSRLGPKVANGSATPDEQAQYAVAVDSYRQPTLRENPVTKETVRVNTRELPAGFPEPPALGSGTSGGTGGGGGSNVVIPGYSPAQQQVERDPAAYKVAESQYDRDSKEVSGIADAGRAAQADQIRIKEMQDVLQRFSTGAGTEARTAAAAWLQRWLPSGITGWEKESANLSGSDAAQAFSKLALTGAGSQERSVLGNRGGFQAIRMFQAANPSINLQDATNKSILDMQLISNQANQDYAQAALSHFADNEKKFSQTHQYDSLAQFDRSWNQQRSPEVYAAAMGAIGGQPASQWTKGLSDAEYARALKVVENAKPGAVVNGKSGRIVVQPPTVTPPPGYTVVPQ